MLAHLSPARVKSVLALVKSVRLGRAITVKHSQRVLVIMAAASSVIPSGLLHMRALQWWLKIKGFSPRGNPFRLIRVTHKCLRALLVWKKPWFLSQGPALGAPCQGFSWERAAYMTIKYKDKETQQRDTKTHRQKPSYQSVLTWTTVM
ncbi:hypothetical protein FQN60_017560 [Etheostoma spectabile]|uniref:Uncharacterized protein n=1 Tax=Etheostoma spectabile TaxID=54343 RepID=A0A5J5DFH7_9PERO|nr:hypothetical protein FQN60_017560 [Etheostoma spectabile]